MSDLRQLAISKATAPYTIITFRDKADENEYVYIALHPELEGCLAQGKTIEEAQKNLADVRVDYIQHLLKFNLPVPIPNVLSSHTASESITNEKTEQGQTSTSTEMYGDKLFEASPLRPD